MPRKKMNTKALLANLLWWAGTELNCRHADFQSAALPTELPAHIAPSNTATTIELLRFLSSRFLLWHCSLKCYGVSVVLQRHSHNPLLKQQWATTGLMIP